MKVVCLIHFHELQIIYGDSGKQNVTVGDKVTEMRKNCISAEFRSVRFVAFPQLPARAQYFSDVCIRDLSQVRTARGRV